MVGSKAQADRDDGRVPRLNPIEQGQAIADLQRRVRNLEEATLAIRAFLDRDLPSGISRNWPPSVENLDTVG